MKKGASPMAGFKTGAAELQKAAQDLETQNQELQGLLSSLQGKLEPLQGVWKGAASTAFHTLLDHYATDAKQLNDRLLDISAAVKGTAATYTQQEEQAAQSMSAITGALG
jgi:WXG100 family type VII secretion target